MSIFTDDFDGADGALVKDRTGWIQVGATNQPVLNGAGGVRSVDTTFNSSTGLTVHDTGVTSHYAECVVGSDALSNSTASADLVCVKTDVSGTSFNSQFGLSYAPGTGTLRLRTGTTNITTAVVSLAAGDVLRLEAEMGAGDTEIYLTAKINGATVIGPVTRTDAGRLSATGVGFRARTGQAQNPIITSFSGGDLGGGDTTAPILSAASGTATGSTTATGSVTTDEAGPAWAVLTTSSTTPDPTQIKAGQDHTGAAAAASDTATLVVGANADVFSFSGLAASTAYWEHVVQDDTATPTANTSTPITSASSFTTDAAADTTNPTMNGSITVGTKTANSISISYSAASDNVGVAGYEVSSNGGSSWSDNGTSLSYTFLGLTELTAYDLAVRAYDAAGNRATPITVNTSTYRQGGTGQFIRDNTAGVDGGPDGIMYNDVVLPGDADKWFSFRIITQNLNGGTLDIDPQGTFTFTGASSGSFTYQLEVDGVDVDENGDPGTYESLVTLYDTTVYRPASDETTTGWTSTGANFFGVLDESPSSDADYVTSPNVSASPGPLVMGIDAIPAGQKVARFRARRTASVGELRQVFLNSSDVEVGATDWVALTGTFALYEPTVYLTGTATKVRVEVRES